MLSFRIFADRGRMYRPSLRIPAMKKSLEKQYFLIVALLSLGIAITIRFPNMMGIIFREGNEFRRLGMEEALTHFAIEFFITLIVAFLMFTMNFFVLKPTGKPGPLKFLHVALAVVLTLASVSVLNHLLFSLSSLFEDEPLRHGRRGEFALTNFFVSALVVGCVIFIRLIYQKQSISIENEALKREALQRQYESLKNQLSPHFLFNSLTALKILIQDAPDKAQHYVSSLSRALRYTLQSHEKQLVSLKEEMDFMESYLYLIRMRFDTNLEVNSSINNELLTRLIPPLTIQTLVENAIKHNEISKRNPLRIDILTPDHGTLRVVNPVQAKLTQEEGTGIGLTNLSKQFLLLIGKDIAIRQENNHFIVDVPLIKP